MGVRRPFGVSIHWCNRLEFCRRCKLLTARLDSSSLSALSTPINSESNGNQFMDEMITEFKFLSSAARQPSHSARSDRLKRLDCAKQLRPIAAMWRAAR
jgi:hypothetical protein